MAVMGEPRQPPTAALDAALGRVGDRWSFLLVAALLDGPLRFADLAERVPGIAPNILVQRLRRLEEQRVVVASPYSDRPPRVAYALTEDGRELAGVLRLLAGWGERAGGEGGVALRHLTCGTALEAHWFCPTCSRTVEDPEASELRFA